MNGYSHLRQSRLEVPLLPRSVPSDADLFTRRPNARQRDGAYEAYVTEN
jgi:hypothetical protein